jgi:hypothetical protein
MCSHIDKDLGDDTCVCTRNINLVVMKLSTKFLKSMTWLISAWPWAIWILPMIAWKTGQPEHLTIAVRFDILANVRRYENSQSRA